MRRLFLFFSLLLPQALLAQNLESVGQGSPVTITGGLSVNQIVYAARGIENRRDPYNYFLSGGINLDIYGLSLPFSFTYSNQESSFRQPFNQFSVNPTYKWVTGHFGFTSMSFSPYTLSGHIFEGAGLDIRPSDKWEIGVMYGRLQRAVQPDTTASEEVIPAFKRIGYGLNLKYGSQLDFVKITFFKSIDDLNSLPDNPSENGVLPEENLVASLGFSKQFLGKFVIKGEYAASALSRDIRADQSSANGEPLGQVGGLFTSRISSSYYAAYNGQLDYRARTYSLGVRYERVGAGYVTHGAYYFNNDFDNFTLRSSFLFLRGKANASVNAGVQSSDLNKAKISTTKRWVGSFNLAYQPTQQVNLNLGYSNFTTFTNINRNYLDVNYLTPYDRLDTLNYEQVAQNASLQFNYNFVPYGKVNRSIMATFTYMESHDIQGGLVQPSSSDFYTFNGGYQQVMTSIGLSLSLLFNLQYNVTENYNTSVVGPAIMVSKLFLERKLRSSFSVAYNHVNTQVANAVSTVNFRAMGNYRFLEKHSLNLSLIAVNRSGGNTEETSSTEFTGMLGYRFNF